MRGFDGIQRGNYFGGEPITRTEVEVRVESLKTKRLWVRMRSLESWYRVDLEAAQYSF